MSEQEPRRPGVPDGSAASVGAPAMPSAGQGELFAGTDIGLPPPPEERVGYRGPVAMKAAGITYRQLDYWARTELVVPSVRPAAELRNRNRPVSPSRLTATSTKGPRSVSASRLRVRRKPASKSGLQSDKAHLRSRAS